MARLLRERPFGFRFEFGSWAAGIAIISAVGILAVGPVIFIVIEAIQANEWSQTLNNGGNQRSLLYSLLLSLRAPVAAFIGFLLAWMLIRIRLPLARFIEFSLWLAFFLPLLPVTLSWILLLDPSYGGVNLTIQRVFGCCTLDIYSIGGILWVHIVASSVPIMVLVLSPAIRQLDSSMEEAARVCGAGTFRLFFDITLPILMPAILTGMLAAFIRSLESFEVEQLLGRPAGIEVYSNRIFDLMSWDPPRIAQAMSLSTIVLTILFIITLLFTVLRHNRDFATISGRASSSHKLEIGRAATILSAFLVGVVLFVVYLPLASLLLGSVMRIFGYFNISDPFTINHWRTVLTDPLFLSALFNSCVLAISAGIIGTLAYSGLAYLIVRGRIPGRRLLDLLCWFPWLIPGLLLSIALLTFSLSFNEFRFLYGSVASLIIVIIIAQLPMGVHMMKTSTAQISEVLEQASRVCGAGRFYTFVLIVLPLVRPMMVSIFTIVFIASMRDIGTLIFLMGAGNQTLSVLGMQFAMSSNLEGAAVIGVITTLIVLTAAMSARHLGLSVSRR